MQNNESLLTLEDEGSPLRGFQIGICGICCVAEVKLEVAIIEQLPNHPLVVLPAHALAYLGILWHLAGPPFVYELQIPWAFELSSGVLSRPIRYPIIPQQLDYEAGISVRLHTAMHATQSTGKASMV